MPRISAEERAAAMFRAGGKPPAPPRELDSEAAKLWREIAAEKPPEWWSPSALRLLRRLCRTAVWAERLQDVLDNEEIGGDRASRLARELVAVNTSLGTLASKLRLTPQAKIDRHSAQGDERGLTDDELLGGHARGPW